MSRHAGNTVPSDQSNVAKANFICKMSCALNSLLRYFVALIESAQSSSSHHFTVANAQLAFARSRVLDSPSCRREALANPANSFSSQCITVANAHTTLARHWASNLSSHHAILVFKGLHG
eukprot:gnl/TRDRNA2_/TRDRNA2_175478_c14_seq1.p1 gnl/TRDRNA2_/TRDRNA2_175478_c14~~gnl/TRDRNA2_/TRDRNA2_175478_c14_seq1.p1  ORF type:complete len:120 (+),score=13.33 gnl/TRDRNA2_/TRDRNA2_175478_c14_seq1:117-476(+)